MVSMALYPFFGPLFQLIYEEKLQELQVLSGYGIILVVLVCWLVKTVFVFEGVNQ